MAFSRRFRSKVASPHRSEKPESFLVKRLLLETSNQTGKKTFVYGCKKSQEKQTADPFKKSAGNGLARATSSLAFIVVITAYKRDFE